MLNYFKKDKNTIALMSPETTPIAAEAKNMRQKFPIAVKNAVAPLPASGLAKPKTVLKIALNIMIIISMVHSCIQTWIAYQE